MLTYNVAVTVMQAAVHEHHPAILAIESEPTIQTPEFSVGFLGIRTRVEFEIGMMPGYTPPSEARRVTPSPPGFNEEYFEWVDVLESVAEAQSEFVMVEVGAGYGRWLMRAAAAARRRGCAFRGVGIEAEPHHFRWMQQHLKDNGIDPRELDLIWAAVGSQPGFVPFWVGKPDAWYGQAVAHQAPGPLPDLRTRRRLKARSMLGRPPKVETSDQAVVWVPSVTLADTLVGYPRVDLMDLDIQGLELEVLTSAIDLVGERVRRVHIGTHSAGVERGLRQLFIEHGWLLVNDYPCHKRVETPYGEIEFGDGVQTWLNPALDPNAAAGQGHSPRQQPAAETPPGPDTDQELQKMVAALKERNGALRAKNDALRAKLGTMRHKFRALKQRSRLDPTQEHD